MSTPFKIGLLGLGFMGRRHLEAYATLPGVEVVTRTSAAFAGSPPEVVNQAMIDTHDLDALDICLPTGQHAPIAIAALDAGKHVLFEKPMALNAEDCQRMLQARDRSGKILMIAHVLRFWPAYTWLHDAVTAHRYTGIRSAGFRRRSGIPPWGPWLQRPEESGGAVLDLLVHDFDQALWLFGEPESATAHTAGSRNVIECMLHYPGGLEVAIAGGWHAGDVPFAMEFDIQASEGEVRYEQEKLRAAGQEVALADLDPYAAQISYFVQCCRERKPPLACPPESSAKAVELALMVSKLML